MVGGQTQGLRFRSVAFLVTSHNWGGECPTACTTRVPHTTSTPERPLITYQKWPEEAFSSNDDRMTFGAKSCGNSETIMREHAMPHGI